MTRLLLAALVVALAGCDEPPNRKADPADPVWAQLPQELPRHYEPEDRARARLDEMQASLDRIEQEQRIARLRAASEIRP